VCVCLVWLSLALPLGHQSAALSRRPSTAQLEFRQKDRLKGQRIIHQLHVPTKRVCQTYASYTVLYGTVLHSTAPHRRRELTHTRTETDVERQQQTGAKKQTAPVAADVCPRGRASRQTKDITEPPPGKPGFGCGHGHGHVCCL
jgi:hypothetical protein